MNFAQGQLLMRSVLVYTGALNEHADFWPETRERLLGPIRQIEAADDDDEVKIAFEELASAFETLPEARSLVELIRADLGVHDRVIFELPSGGSDVGRYVALTQPSRVDLSTERVASTAHVVRRGLEGELTAPTESLFSEYLRRGGLQGITTSPPEGPIVVVGEGTDVHEGPTASERYLNAGLFHNHAAAPMGASEAPPPGRYELRVNVGSFWGPGSPDVPFPDDLLAEAFDQEDVLQCHVAALSATALLAPQLQELRLPRVGDSPPVTFLATFPEPQRHGVTVCLFYKGHLLQARRLDVEVRDAGAPAVGQPAPPMQDARTIFTRQAELDLAALEGLARNPRRLTIVVDHSLVERISLHFFETTGDHSEEFAHVETELSLGALKTQIEDVRSVLTTVMDAYVGGVGGSDAALLAQLGPLAVHGRRFYLALLPPAGSGADKRAYEDLPAGTVIQVDPLSAQPSVPWEVLYERPTEDYRPTRTRLCETFRQHGSAAADCPHAGDPRVVCPHAFWGFRYIVEQLPSRTARGEPVRTLPTKVRNAGGLQLGAFVSTKLHRFEGHLANLQALGTPPAFEVQPILSLDEAETALKPPAAARWGIVYFYTHGGRRGDGLAFLGIGASDEITTVDLDAWNVSLARSPLVVLNACESARYTPEDFENIVLSLCGRGAAGVVATQCSVREILADAMIVPFLGSFFRSVEGGRAILAARWALLGQGDPRGLAYSLFASADVVLEEALAA